MPGEFSDTAITDVGVQFKSGRTGIFEPVRKPKLEFFLGVTPKVTEQLRTSGEILPADHQFVQLLFSIGQRINLPPDYSIIGLDSDEVNAFCLPKEKVIVVSRALGKQALEKGLDLKEDHLAAVLCHEFTHQDSPDRVPNQTKSHSEELRADAEGMERLALAGYNPKAMIEFYKTLGLTSGRQAVSHPETIDRIRHLELRLTDDIHPIPNVGKKMKSIDEQIVNYLKEDSNVYEETERLLSLSADQLQAEILATDRPEDYWLLYPLERHARRIETARTLAKNPALQRIVRKSVLFRAISEQPYCFVNGELNEIYGSKFSEQIKLQEATGKSIDYTSHSHLKLAFDMETNSSVFLESLPYRLGLPEGTVDATTQSEFEERLIKTETALDEMIARQYRYFERQYIKDKLPAFYQTHLARVKELIDDELKPLTAEVMAGAFSSIEKRVLEHKLTKKQTWLAERGLRSAKEQDYKTCDFSDPGERQRILEAAYLSTAAQLLERLPENQKTQTHWSTILEKFYGLTPDEAQLFGDYMFWRNEDKWFNYLAEIPRPDLPAFHEKIIRIAGGAGGIRSSPREKGKAYRASSGYFDVRSPVNQEWLQIHNSHNYLIHPFWPRKGDFDEEKLRTSLNVATGTMCPWELYRRGNPAERQARFNRNYDGLAIDLSDQEYQFVVDNLNGRSEAPTETMIIETQRKSAALIRCLRALGNNERPNKNDLDRVKGISDFSRAVGSYFDRFGLPINLSFDDINLLYQHIPWTREERAKNLMTWFGQSRRQVSELIPGQRQDLRLILTDFYQCYPESDGSVTGPFSDKRPTKDRHDADQERARVEISKWLVDLTLSEMVHDLSALGDQEERLKVIEALKSLHEQGIHISISSFSSDTIEHYFFDIEDYFFKQATPAELEQLAQIFDDQKERYDFKKLTFSEFLRLLSITPVAVRNAVGGGNDIFSHQPRVYSETIKELLDRFNLDSGLSSASKQAAFEYQYNMAYRWVMTYFQPSQTRDHLLAGLAEAVPHGQERQLGLVINSGFSDIDVNFSLGPKGDNTYPYGAYSAHKREVSNTKLPPELLILLQGEGRLKREFADILARRQPFTVTARSIDFTLLSAYVNGVVLTGSPSQRFFARELLAVEDQLFNGDLPLNQRLKLLTETAPCQSPVRDTYVEWMLKDGLEAAKTAKERYELAGQLLSLFSKDCRFKQPFVLQRLRDEIEITENFWVASSYALEIVIKYLPEASLARNYFLDLIEEKCPLTPNEIEKINSLRVSEEGQRKNEETGNVEAGSEVMVLNALAEQNREEKVKTVLWVLGVSEEKPLAVDKIEKEQDGSLDSFRRNFAGLTPPERDVLLTRMLLGAEGILDLEAVPISQQAEAIKKRDQFLTTLAQYFILKDSPSSAVFQKIFVTIFQNAQPARGAQMLEKLINLSIDRTAKNGRFTTEELVASSLSQLGVVGKKVGQSLAEMDWVQASYKRELTKSQEGAETLPKRSLLVFAKAAGLIEDGSPIKITSFDKLLGAASNKQACLLTVQVNDEALAKQLGINPGETTQVVGKFKRPSAQKEENIEQDLLLLTKVVEVIRGFGTEVSLPPGFSDQIGMAVRQELDFEREKGFAEKMEIDISKRGSYKGYTVTIPEIVYSGPDLVLETQAPGNSLRGVIDQQRASNLSEDKINASLASVKAVILREALYEILHSGNIHADLHPGNIFVNEAGRTLTLIDLGMHTEISSRSILAAREVLIGLALGKRGIITRALKDLGWPLDKKSLKFKTGDFNGNTKALLLASKNAEKPPPTDVGMIILSVSKLEPYLKGVKLGTVMEILKEIIPPSQWKLHLEALAIEEGMAAAEKVIGKRKSQ